MLITLSIGLPKAQFVSGTHHDLHARPFLSLDTSSVRSFHQHDLPQLLTVAKSEGNTGHVGVLAHKQPVLEKHLRSVVQGCPTCELRTSCTLTSIFEDGNWVYVTYSDASGTEKKLRAKFLAAADGKTGFTRKMYLELKGIQLDWAEQ